MSRRIEGYVVLKSVMTSDKRPVSVFHSSPVPHIFNDVILKFRTYLQNKLPVKMNYFT